MDKRDVIIIEVDTLALNLSNDFQVTYQTELFLDKNKDYVVAEHQALLCASKCSFVSSLFQPLAEESSKSSKFSSIGSRFKVWFSYLLGIRTIVYKELIFPSCSYNWYNCWKL